MRKLLLAAVAAVSLAAASVASAAPMMQVRISVNGSVIATTAPESSGSAGITTIGNPAFDAAMDAVGFNSLSVSADGVPLIPTPEISTTALEASAPAGGTRVLKIEITQYDLEAYVGQLANTFTGNTLTSGGNFGTFTIEHFFNASNTAFGTETLMATGDFTGQGNIPGASGPTIFGVDSMGALFSETVVYTIEVTGNGSISGTSQITNVPEPATLALFGTALLGFGLARARRRQA